MPRTGRPPVPTRLKLVRGNPGKRPLPKNEPQLPVELPTPPADLTEGERRAWADLSGPLLRMRVLTIADSVELEGLACWLALYRDARQHVRDEGSVIPTERNTQFTSPWYGVMSNAWKHFDTLACRFGLTPADRSKLQTVGPEQASAYEQSRKRT